MKTIETLIEANEAPMVDDDVRQKMLLNALSAVAILINLTAIGVLVATGMGKIEQMEPRTVLAFIVLGGLGCFVNTLWIISASRQQAAAKKR